MMKLPRFDTANVLVIGDVMLDRYCHGRTRRVSAEAPIPVVDVQEVEERPGAAANVALNVVSLGSRATLIGMIGDDESGSTLTGKLAGAGIECLLQMQPDYPTTTKLRIVSRSQQLARADFERYQAMPSNVLQDVIAAPLETCDNVLLSDYDKGVLADPQAVIAPARALNKPVIVDPKFKDFREYRGAAVVKPNRLELQNAVGSWSTEAEMVAKCQRLITDLGIDAMLVTRSTEGMTLIRQTGKELHFPARTREVYDVTGAGDTVVATVCAALGSGETLADAVGLANIAAGLVVSHFGITSVSGPELRQEVASEMDYETGRMSQEQLQIVVEEARAHGEKIVLTNGCFDILHAGHVDYLAEARSVGDRLIVAVNGDESVRRLKGDGRPINSVDHRMTLLAGLSAVDWVVSFDDDTPAKLIADLKPDVLVKGGDYEIDQVVGADIVKSYNGEVRVLTLVEDCSTSALVQKIREL
jgi:D-beta-D-heptose 7-phosphate kinase / D-beta-D-heptose 1-phosphate adenosyltransferase